MSCYLKIQLIYWSQNLIKYRDYILLFGLMHFYHVSVLDCDISETDKTIWLTKVFALTLDIVE